METNKLIQFTARDIIAAIREHGPTQDVIIPRLADFAYKIEYEAMTQGFKNGALWASLPPVRKP